MKKISIIMIFLFFPVMLMAQDDTKPEISAAQAIENSRLLTIKYGTETEIATLIQSLIIEDADYLDDELVTLINNTKNQKILTGVFGFFGSREKKGLEDRALRAIEDRDDEARETVLAAVDYLGRTKTEKAQDALMELLDSEERRYMNNAFRALGRTGGAGEEAGDTAAEYLIDYYTNREPGDDNRREIIIAVGETRSTAGIDFLCEIANDTQERLPLRMAALDSLSKIGSEEGLSTIIDAVNANDPNLRSSAVAALGPFSGDNVDQAILDAFRDSYYRTRLAAAQASRQRKLVAAVPYLKFRAERDDVPQVRDESIRALGEIANAEALETINALFVERKSSDRVRLESANALMKNNPSKNLPQLVIELDEAKQKNMTPLYNGFLKIVGETRADNMEDITKRLLQAPGIIERSYALDMAANNNLSSLADEIKAISTDKNESLARKARRTMEKLNITSD